jgi:hypothetical protein
MKYKLSKVPPLQGNVEQKIETMRNYYNRLCDELIRVVEQQEKEIENLRKERNREKS